MKLRVAVLFAIVGIVVLVLTNKGQNSQYVKSANLIQKEDSLAKTNKDSVLNYPDTILVDEPGAWYTKYHFIAHGGGGIDGRTYTNSRDAWQHSYDLGNRIIDADLSYTSDNHLVLRHNWMDNLEQTEFRMEESRAFLDSNGHYQFLISQEPMDLATFVSRKIFAKYTPMTLEDMIVFMDLHDDLYVSTDMKGDVVQSYKDLMSTATDMGKRAVLDRIVVNLYRQELYDIIMQIYPWKNVTMRQHYVDKRDYLDLFDFCIKNNIHVVNISSCYMEEKEVQIFVKSGIHVFVAVVDYISDMRYYKKLGASGAVSSWLSEEDWKYVEENE